MVREEEEEISDRRRGRPRASLADIAGVVMAAFALCGLIVGVTLYITSPQVDIAVLKMQMIGIQAWLTKIDAKLDLLDNKLSKP